MSYTLSWSLIDILRVLDFQPCLLGDTAMLQPGVHYWSTPICHLTIVPIYIILSTVQDRI